jgi:hypothetical protein
MLAIFTLTVMGNERGFYTLDYIVAFFLQIFYDESGRYFLKVLYSCLFFAGSIASPS